MALVLIGLIGFLVLFVCGLVFWFVNVFICLLVGLWVVGLPGLFWCFVTCCVWVVVVGVWGLLFGLVWFGVFVLDLY